MSSIAEAGMSFLLFCIENILTDKPILVNWIMLLTLSGSRKAFEPANFPKVRCYIVLHL